jgi:membrane protease YdiL (CAAX protease family)
MRGGLQALLARSMGDLHSISLTALAFAAMHVVGGDRSWLEVANIALAGIVFGLLMAGTKSLLAPVCAHMTWNLMEACIGLYQNPGLAPFGALFDVDLQGPPLWGGSASGLGGSVALTMATVAVLAGLYPGRQASSMRRV